MNIKNHVFITTLILLMAYAMPSIAQQYRFPVNVTPALSANFGELRSNHFHSGIDFKTEQVVNKPIFAIANGYISRISVSPGGYGLALYIDHPATGHTSVYGHLNSFSKEIAEWVKARQYEMESYTVNLYPDTNELPVKAGQQIALSGNTGGSGGPHLHFEIRDTQSEHPLDPLQYLANIPDTRKPDIRGIAFYPIYNKGIVNGIKTPTRLNIGKDSNGNPLGLPQTINAWGTIGIGVKAYDRMNGQSNIYGVRNVRLFVDDKQVFSSSLARFSFSDTRMINTFTDFEDWKNRRSFYMKSFVEPGNTLPFINAVNSGYIEINEERPYKLRYELEDFAGNVLKYNFTINGKSQPIEHQFACDNSMFWDVDNNFSQMGFIINIPRNSLYNQICFNYKKTKTEKYFSDIHQVHDTPVPLHNRAEMWIMLNTDTLENKSNYGVVSINKNGTENWIGGKYGKGGVTATISELGNRYAISCDTIAPTITPVSPETWKSQRRISIRLRDNKSGISSFRGEINGKFILFKHDIKSTTYTYLFDNERLPKDEKLIFTFTAIDGAGNSTQYTKEL